MAIGATYTKKQEELARGQQAVGSNKPYTGMQGVNQNTANNLGNYQQGYQQGQQAQAANNYLQQIQAQKPASYNSKYGEQLDSLLKQIQNPQDFKYEFNGDNLFKYFADLYTQKGKQASMDAQGQAAGLTGGYGNSYGQMLGQQQYQQYLLNLYDKGMDLRDRAYQAHRDQIGDQKDAYGLTAQAEATDYGRYRDTVGDWENERAYAANRADTEREFDYNQYRQDLDYWTGLAQVENAAYNTEAERQEAIRQYEQNFAFQKETDARDFAEQQRLNDRNFAEGQRQFDASMAQSEAQFNATNKLNYDKLAQDQAQFDASLGAQERENNRKYAVEYVSAILANGQIPSNELLVAAGLSYEDAMKLIAEVQRGGTGGPAPEPTPEPEPEEDKAFDVANIEILQSDLENHPEYSLNHYNQNLSKDIKLGDLKKKINTQTTRKAATESTTANSGLNAYINKFKKALGGN